MLKEIEAEEIGQAIGYEYEFIDRQKFKPNKNEEKWLFNLAKAHKIIGKLSPSMTKGEGARTPVKWDFITNETNGIAELNNLSGLPPVTLKQFKGIMGRMLGLRDTKISLAAYDEMRASWGLT